jgi:DNA mismatch repair ATPase MutS
VKEALSLSEKNGLVLIDELARGTNPHEGYAISKAIISYLMDKPSITVITTHFDGLADKGIRHLQVKGLRDIDFKNIKNPDAISEYMDYTLMEVEGESNVPRDAINISRLMGIPEKILLMAENIMNKEKARRKRTIKRSKRTGKRRAKNTKTIRCGREKDQ